MKIDMQEEYGVDLDYDILVEIEYDLLYGDNSDEIGSLFNYMITLYEHLSITDEIIDNYCVYVDCNTQYRVEFINDTLISAATDLQYCKKCIEMFCEYVYKSDNRDFALMAWEKDQVHITYPLIKLITLYREAMMKDITDGFTEESANDLLLSIKEIGAELSRMCRRYTDRSKLS